MDLDEETPDADRVERVKQALRREQVGDDGKRYLSVHYGPGESGWVEALSDNTARVSNVPFGEDDITIDDIVELSPPWEGCCNRPVVGRVISRKYMLAASVSYRSLKDWDKITAAFRAKGWCVEGGVPPMGGKPGLASLAFFGDDDLVKVAEAAGAENDPRRERGCLGWLVGGF